MEIEQLEGKADLRQHVPLDPTARADEKGLDARVFLNQGARNREPGIQMPPGSPAREDDPHRAGSARRARGSVAEGPNAFSRVLPMFTRIPVMRSDKMRFDRP